MCGIRRPARHSVEPSGPFSLRLLDRRGNVVATSSDGYANITDQTYYEQGSRLVVRVPQGAYVAQILMTAGSNTHYTVEIDWRARAVR